MIIVLTDYFCPLV